MRTLRPTSPLPVHLYLSPSHSSLIISLPACLLLHHSPNIPDSLTLLFTLTGTLLAGSAKGCPLWLCSLAPTVNVSFFCLLQLESPATSCPAHGFSLLSSKLQLAVFSMWLWLLKVVLLPGFLCLLIELQTYCALSQSPSAVLQLISLSVKKSCLFVWVDGKFCLHGNSRWKYFSTLKK